MPNPSRLRVGMSVGLLAVALAHPTLLHAEDSREAIDWARPFEIGLDVMIWRPVGVVRVAAGAVAFLPISAAASIGGRRNVAEAFETLVAAPAEWVFDRPIGDLE